MGLEKIALTKRNDKAIGPFAKSDGIGKMPLPVMPDQMVHRIKRVVYCALAGQRQVAVDNKQPIHGRDRYIIEFGS